jgi:predicted nuclease with TOPRIM domain
MLVNVQTKRETYEHLSQDRMGEFKLAQERCVELRKTIGLRTVERAWPWFEAFMQSRGLSEECAEKIHRLRKEMAGLREEYRDCMRELESISTKVHSIRERQHQS